MNTYCVKTLDPEARHPRYAFYSAPSIDTVVNEVLRKSPYLLETKRTEDVVILENNLWGVRIEAISPIQLTGEKS